MNLTKEQRETILNNFKRFVEDLKAYDIINNVKVYVDIRYSNKNTRFDYVEVYTNKEIYVLGQDVNTIIKDIEKNKDCDWYENLYKHDYNKILDVMNNKERIFAELEKENNKNKDILNDILNY